MLTIPDKILVCSLILTACGILFAALYTSDGSKGEDLSGPSAIFVLVTLAASPLIALLSILWIVCTL